MGKLPAFLMYAKDWLTDTELRICTKGAKGVWADMLCLMFLAPNCGVAARADGTPWSDEEIAQGIGGDTTANLEHIRELLAKGVAHRNQRGAIFSRRLLRDGKERKEAKLRQRKHRKEITEQSSHSFVTPVVTPLSGDANEIKEVKILSPERIQEVAREMFQPSAEIDAHMAAKKVHIELQLAGDDALLLCTDAVRAHAAKNACSFADSADGLIAIHREYESKPRKFKRGVFKFFKEGLWARPESWDDGSDREASKAEQRITRSRENILKGLGVGANLGGDVGSGGADLQPGSAGGSSQSVRRLSVGRAAGTD